MPKLLGTAFEREFEMTADKRVVERLASAIELRNGRRMRPRNTPTQNFLPAVSQP